MSGVGGKVKSPLPLSERLRSLQASPIGEVFERALQLKREGRCVLDLSRGEPDFDTDRHVAAAARAAIDAGDTRYTATDGSSEMKAAVRRKLIRDGHSDYSDECLIIGNGGMAVLAHIGLAMLDPGDEVLIPAPCWPTHPGMVTSLGAKSVLLPTRHDENYKLQPCVLRQALSANTRALILCSPCNPTGAVYGADELQALAAVLDEFPDVWIVSDEIYSDITFDGVTHRSVAVTVPDLAHRTVTLNGMSKGYAMTGWRLAYAAGPPALMAGARQLMSHVAGSPSTISQAAAIAALDGDQSAVAERREHYQRRRDLIVNGLSGVQGLRVSVPAGTFYLFVDCQGLLGCRSGDGDVIDSSLALARHLLEHAGVAIVPGEAFAAPGTLRLCFAAREQVLIDASDAIAAAVADLA